MGSFSPPSEISQNSQDHFTTDDNNSTIDVPSENGETLVKKITITFDMAMWRKLQCQNSGPIVLGPYKNFLFDFLEDKNIYLLLHQPRVKK